MTMLPERPAIWSVVIILNPTQEILQPTRSLAFEAIAKGGKALPLSLIAVHI